MPARDENASSAQEGETRCRSVYALLLSVVEGSNFFMMKKKHYQKTLNGANHTDARRAEPSGNHPPRAANHTDQHQTGQNPRRSS